MNGVYTPQMNMLSVCDWVCEGETQQQIWETGRESLEWLLREL